MIGTRHRTKAKLARVSAFAIAIVFGASIGGAVSAADTTPPSKILDLRVSQASAAPQLHLVLAWSAPSDVTATSTIGPAKSYDIRYSTASIGSDAAFNAARSITGSRTVSGVLPLPLVPGTTQQVEVVGLSPKTPYFFAVKSIDAAGNVSPFSNVPTATTAKYEGYGNATLGGGDGKICRVTSLDSSGTGTLRDCLFAPTRSCTTEPLTVVFDVAGKITLTSDISLNFDDCRLTIDGSTSPSPGISIGMIPCPSGLTSCPVGHACIGGGKFLIGQDETTSTDQVILTHLRFQGNYQQGWNFCEDNSAGTLGMQYHFSNIVLDHLTIRNGPDSSPDLWTGHWASHGVTMSNTLIAWSPHPLLLSSSHSEPAGSRDDVSIHHNIIARAGQRMPLISGESTDIDFRNNIIFDWASAWTGITSGDATQIEPFEEASGWKRPSVNLVNNYWKDKANKPSLGLYYGSGPGTDSTDGGPAACVTSNGCSACPAQGTVVTGTNMGQMWVSGNILPSANCDQWSTVSAERAVPVAAKVTTVSASELVSTVLPGVGTRFRTTDETALIAEIAGALGCGNGSRGTGELCDGADLGGKRCQDFGFSGGTLSCTNLCTFNTSACTTSVQSPSPVNNLRRTDKHP
jgi:pectate lyase